jgi:hypothetical protein
MDANVIQVPPEMMKAIEKIVANERYLAFDSAEEFAREALRESIRRYR